MSIDFIGVDRATAREMIASITMSTTLKNQIANEQRYREERMERKAAEKAAKKAAAHRAAAVDDGASVSSFGSTVSLLKRAAFPFSRKHGQTDDNRLRAPLPAPVLPTWRGLVA